MLDITMQFDIIMMYYYMKKVLQYYYLETRI